MSEPRTQQYDFSPGLRLEKRIEDAAGEGLRIRWEFGGWMLAFVPEGQKKLPDGFLSGLVDATGCSRTELQYRRQFAEDFDAGALSNALDNRLSWHEIVNDLLVRSPDRTRDEAEVGEWETPRDLYDQLDSEFGFELDVCAHPDNALCERFFSPDEDGLRQPWRGNCWMHPPTGRELEQWVAKAHRAAEDKGTTVVCLLPARVDATWWWEHCLSGEIRFLQGRLDFAGRDAPFPSAVVIFGRKPRVVWWDRSKEVGAV